VLGWETNKTHKHSIVKTTGARVPGVRYGLTFRTMKTSTRDIPQQVEGLLSGRIALTFGERAEARAGGPMEGLALAPAGFTVAELRAVVGKIAGSQLTTLHDKLEQPLQATNEAAILVIKDGVKRFGVDPSELLKEQSGITYDKKQYRDRFNDTVNSLARHNIVFGSERKEHSDDYKQNTVAAWSEVPLLAKMRAALPTILGEKAKELNAEGNHYYDVAKCGIGFHGDAERKIVVCCSLGDPATLRFKWKAPINVDAGAAAEPVDIKLEHGDIYIMSEKAAGWDARRTSQWRLVHAAGSSKFIDA
jgi:alkylated DNA repair dioxygenase AlkB